MAMRKREDEVFPNAAGIDIGASSHWVAVPRHLAEAAGCDPKAVRAALMGGFADSRILELHGARMVAGDYTPGGRSVAQLKDIVNALAVAQERGLDLPLANTVEAGFRDLVEQYDGADLDHSAYHHWLKLSGRVPDAGAR